jgi:hypothetical protein
MPAAVARRGTVALTGIGILLSLALPTASSAQASIIYACVKKKGGAVHVVSKNARCNRREAKRSWNRAGPTGATGPVSASGASGANGAGGLNGSNGVTGATGPTGATTETSTAGATGANGSNGVTGPTGVTGATGATGGTGPSGVTGVNGATGVTGTSGATGTTGGTGPSGPTGVAGAVSGYSARQAPGKHTFTSATESSPTTIVSRELPAGSYIVDAKVEVQLSNTTAEGGAAVVCTLVDTPTEGGTPATDRAGLMTPIDVLYAGFFFATNSLPLTLVVSSPAHTSKIVIACYVSLESANGGEFSATASNAAITAVQTTQNS